METLQSWTRENIQDLISQGQTLDVIRYDKENGSNSPLTFSIFNNDAELFDQILQSGADINFSVRPIRMEGSLLCDEVKESLFFNKTITTSIVRDRF